MQNCCAVLFLFLIHFKIRFGGFTHNWYKYNPILIIHISYCFIFLFFINNFYNSLLCCFLSHVLRQSSFLLLNSFSYLRHIILSQSCCSHSQAVKGLCTLHKHNKVTLNKVRWAIEHEVIFLSTPFIPKQTISWTTQLNPHLCSPWGPKLTTIVISACLIKNYL